MSSPNLKLITTEDGSHSLLRADLNETYHSTKGARGESAYVFIEHGLNYYLELTHTRKVNILEVGLGTGLNALLTAHFASLNELDVHYVGLEPFPVPGIIFKDLNYAQSEDETAILHDIHHAPWGEVQQVSDFFTLIKQEQTLEEYFTTETYHLIYFDAFAPSKQPELWAFDNLRKCHELLRTGGVLSTYCAQGQFKRNLAEIGFEVQTLPGALGKKEMVRAIKRA